MSRAKAAPRLFPTPVIRGLLLRATQVLRDEKEKETLKRWQAVTLARFAAWFAAVEGAVELVPEVVDLCAIEGSRGLAGDTYADFHGPLSALAKVVGAGRKGPDAARLEDEMTRHRSPRVRNELAFTYAAALVNDPDPTVRLRARYKIGGKLDPPWWVGVLDVAPPARPEVLKFGELTGHLSSIHDWTEASELAAALRKMPPELAGRIAPMFMPSIWCPQPYVDAVWEALVRAPRPLGERLRAAEKVVATLMSAGPCLEPAHGPAIEQAVAGCPDEERAAFHPLVERVRAAVDRPGDAGRSAPWSAVERAARPRRARGGAPRATACKRALFEALVAELASPGAWGESRFAAHPRARFELGRGLEVLLEGSTGALRDVVGTARRLADIVAEAAERRPGAGEASALALGGLLRALDAGDPLFAELVRHPSATVREAAALSAMGDAEARYVDPLLADAVPEVWTAARAAAADREPWRGLFVSDPFEGCRPDEAEALVPALIALDGALPRVRHAVLSSDDYMRAGRAALPSARTSAPGSLRTSWSTRWTRRPSRRTAGRPSRGLRSGGGARPGTRFRGSSGRGERRGTCGSPPRPRCGPRRTICCRCRGPGAASTRRMRCRSGWRRSWSCARSGS